MSEPKALDYRPLEKTGRVVWIQTGAMLLDAYRELNARKLFWITMLISVVVAAAFAMVGIDDRGISFLTWRFEFLAGWNTHVLSAGKFYKFMFSAFAIPLWLAWPATILGLVSTASMFPDFLSSGAVDLYLARPLSRLRLFMTKYLMGLLFMALQVTVFTIACFLIIGIRGGAWEPSLFLAVPIVTLVFSFLFAISALLGTLTRSTIAAVLLTLICWVLFAVVNNAEAALLPFQKVSQRNVARLTKTVGFWDKALATTRTRDFEFQRNAAIEALDKEQASLKVINRFYNIIYVIKFPLPKTAESTDLLRRFLVKHAELPFDTTTMPSEDEPVTFTEPTTNPEDRRGPRQRGARRDRDQQAEAIQAEIQDTRSISYTLGTSIGFEAVLLVIAAWVFCRRDY
jgi:ABC-type transport system involved in multi-copper enzyme maturation permease subunit